VERDQPHAEVSLFAGLLESIVEEWRADPADAGSLAVVRAGFLVIRAIAVSSGNEQANQLSRAVSNLLDRLDEGTLEPSEGATGAVADSAAFLGARAQAGDEALDRVRLGDLVERLDALASGLTEPLDEHRSTVVTPGEPPLLTLRDDGVRVRPGSLGTQTRPNGPADGLPLALTMDALDALAGCLREQIADLHALRERSPDDAERRRRLAGRLHATARLMEALKNPLSGRE